MKSLALDLDSGRLTRWVGDPQDLKVWNDRYGDKYTLRVRVYRGSGGVLPDVNLQMLVKKPRRRDAAALWSLDVFTPSANFSTPMTREFLGVVDVSGAAYAQALKVDSGPGNDVESVSFLGILRAVSGSDVVEAEFDYTITNSGYRQVDAP